MRARRFGIVLFALALGADGRAACVERRFAANVPSEAVYNLNRYDVGYSGVAADFNGDGWPDIIAATANLQGTDTILFGSPGGRFFAHRTKVSSVGPTISVAADLNGDGALDLVLASHEGAEGNRIAVVLGRGDGTFGPERILHNDLAPMMSSVAVADVDGDGRPDVIVAGTDFRGNGYLLTYKGGGDGDFFRSSFLAVPSMFSLVVGDFNGDGKPDVAGVSQENMLVFVGRGDGTFASSQTIAFPKDQPAFTLVAADFDGDGRLDLVLTTYDLPAGKTGELRLLHGRGDGTFDVGTAMLLNTLPDRLTAADLDGDGRVDLVEDFESSGAILMNLGGTFAAPQGESAGGRYAIDVDGDGFPDLVGFSRSGTINVSINGCGHGTFIRSSADAVVTGGSVTLTTYGVFGRVIPPVTFRDGNSIFSNGSSQVTTTLTTPGRHSITATTADGAVTAPLIITVQDRPPTATISTARGQTIYAENVLIQGTVLTPGGQPVPLGDVDILEGTKVVTTTTVVAGKYEAAITPSVGHHDYSARFNGAGSWPASEVTSSLAHDVAPSPTSITSSVYLRHYCTQSFWEIAVTVAAPFSLPAGTVHLTVPGLGIDETLPLMSGSVVHYSTHKVIPGTYTVTATYAGDGNDLPSRADATLAFPDCGFSVRRRPSRR